MKLSKNELIAGLNVSVALASSGLISTIVGKGHSFIEIVLAALVTAPIVYITSRIDSKFRTATRHQILSGARLAIVIPIVLTIVFVADFTKSYLPLPLVNKFAMTVLVAVSTLIAWAWATLWTVVFHEVLFPKKSKTN